MFHTYLVKYWSCHRKYLQPMSAAVSFQSRVHSRLGTEVFTSFQHSNISAVRRVKVALARQRAEAIFKLSCSVSQNLWEKIFSVMKWLLGSPFRMWSVRCCYTEILLLWLLWLLILTLLEECLSLGEDSKQYCTWVMEPTIQSGVKREKVKYGAGPSIPLGCVYSATWSGLIPAISLVSHRASLDFAEACAWLRGLCVKFSGLFPPY